MTAIYRLMGFLSMEGFKMIFYGLLCVFRVLEKKVLELDMGLANYIKFLSLMKTEIITGSA